MNLCSGDTGPAVSLFSSMIISIFMPLTPFYSFLFCVLFVCCCVGICITMDSESEFCHRHWPPPCGGEQPADGIHYNVNRIFFFFLVHSLVTVSCCVLPVGDHTRGFRFGFVDVSPPAFFCSSSTTTAQRSSDIRSLPRLLISYLSGLG